MELEAQLTLILAEGLPREIALRLAQGEAPLDAADALIAQAAHGRRGTPPRSVCWPGAGAAARLADRLSAAGIDLVWRGERAYPRRLADRLDAPPAWLWRAGPPGRLATLACAVVGSRVTPEPLLQAARRLGRALAEGGVTVVSGMAPGADCAAHAGAQEGAAGTIALPARGLLTVDLTPAHGRGARMTALGLDLPAAPFSAGLAVRRNAMIAAMGEGLVLVASELRGGSSYAVRWALEHGHPLWCFEAGRATPPANRALLHSGQARPLALNAPPEDWLAAIRPALEAQARRPSAPPPSSQIDWIGPG